MNAHLSKTGGMDRAQPWDLRFEETVRQHLPLLKADEQLNSNTPFVSLGADSLGLVSLMVQVEDRFGIVFPDEMLNETIFSNPGSLWSAVEQLLDQS